MYIDRLKRKYQQILHGTSKKQQHSQSQRSLTPKSTSKFDKKTKLLTEHCENTHKNNTYSASSSFILALKERIAQATHNLKDKDEQCSKLKEEIVRKDEQIRMYEQQLAQTKVSIQNNQKKVVEAKVFTAELEKNIEALHKQLEACAIDRELALKQAQFYKKQSSQVKKQKKNVQKAINSSQKYIKQIDSVRSQNSRLRQDIKRMQVVINEMCHLDKQEINLADKHYLGKPLKQASNWFPQNLVGEVQHFLKKQQIGQGNKNFLNNLVKFISKYAASVSRNSTKGSETNSRVKSSGKNSHCRSVSLCDAGYSFSYEPGTSFIRKTQGIGTSGLKKSLLLGKYKKYDSRKYTIESLMLPERDGENITTCEKILNEYKKVLNEALRQKQVKAKVILGLTEEMSSAIAQLFQNQSN